MLWGGALLVLSALVLSATTFWSGSSLSGNLLFAAALIIFAFTGSRETNLVNRSAPALVALVLLGVWDLAVTDIAGFLGAWSTPEYGEIRVALMFLRYAVLAIVVVRIGRNTQLPSRWRWAPTAAAAAHLVASIFPQLLPWNVNDAAMTPAQEFVIHSAAPLVFTAVPVFLGILALIRGVVIRGTDVHAASVPTASGRTTP